MYKKTSILLLIFILSTGCSASNTPAARQNMASGGTNAVVRNSKPTVYKREAINTPKAPENPQPASPKPSSSSSDDKSVSVSKRARKISDAVTKIDGIDKSSVVITGNTAIIGITGSKEIDDTKLIKYKKDIEKTVKETDNKIDHVTVTDAKDLVERITNMADSVTERNDYPPEYDAKIKELTKKITR